MVVILESEFSPSRRRSLLGILLDSFELLKFSPVRREQPSSLRGGSVQEEACLFCCSLAPPFGSPVILEKLVLGGSLGWENSAVLLKEH